MPANWNEYVRRRMPALGVRPERESEIVAELAEQMRQAYQEWIALGHSEEEAMSHAEVQVRDWSALGTELRDAERPAPRYRFLPGLRHDIRYSLRGLRRNPVFACVAIATLAFAIAGNTAIFAVVDHIALHGLPYPDAARLLAIEHTRVDEPGLESWCAIDNLLDLRKNNQTFQAIAGVSPVWNVVMTGEGEVERLESLFASSDFFPMLGVTPLIGRLFSAADDNRAGAAPVVVLSHSFWARRFGASPAVLGRTLVLDGQPFAIVGVLPRDFRWLGEPLAGTAINIDLWMPLAANQLARSPRTLRFLKVTGQLKPGVSTQQGIDEVRRIGESLTPAFPAANKNLTFTAVPLEQKIAGRVRPAVYLLLATVGFVLLMASANVANLLLARAAGRKQELSIRVALGASPGRLIRQWMTESGVIAILGGGLGVLLAHVFLRLILEYGPPATVKTVPISLDWRAMLFSGGVVMLTAVLSGIVPAWRTMSGPALREGRGTTKGNRRVRSLLVVTQVTLAVVLLSGAGLLVRSFLQVLKVDPGFNLHNVVSISTQLPAGANTAEQRTNVYHKIRDELLAVPGVTAVAAVSRLPL
ncbi:MAG: ABC transporter permease, partial [Bryobacteraceae bacterium]